MHEAAAAVSAKGPGGSDERSFRASDLWDPGEVASGIAPDRPVVALYRVIKREVNQYDDEVPIDPESPESSPLSWWQKNESRFPNISKVARHLLSIPASTAELERMFSRAGVVAGPRRPRLRPQSATEVMFCHENIRRGVF